MTKYIQKTNIGIVFILVILNMYFFISTMTFGDKVLKIEHAINRTRSENGELEKKLYAVDSIHNLQKRAKQLGFSKRSSLIRIDSLKYALRHE